MPNTERGNIQRLFRRSDAGGAKQELDALTQGVTSQDLQSFDKVLGAIVKNAEYTTDTPLSIGELQVERVRLQEAVALDDQLSPKKPSELILKKNISDVHDWVGSRRDVFKRVASWGGGIALGGALIGGTIKGIDHIIEADNKEEQKKKETFEGKYVLTGKSPDRAVSYTGWQIYRPSKDPTVIYSPLTGENATFGYGEKRFINFEDKAGGRWNDEAKKHDVNLMTGVTVDDFELQLGKMKGNFVPLLGIKYNGSGYIQDFRQTWHLGPTNPELDLQDDVVVFENSKLPDTPIYTRITVIDHDTDYMQIQLLEQVKK